MRHSLPFVIGVDEVGRAASRRRASPQTYVVGVDEVGRGPLAGPLVVGAVMMPRAVYKRKRNNPLYGIRDSKKLSAVKRNAWRVRVMSDARFASAVSSVGPATIDRIGITAALEKAVSGVLKNLGRKTKRNIASAAFVYLDGSLHAPPEFAQETVIGGDERIPIVSAASIIAKVARDTYMIRLDARWPAYGFARHKGYGTKIHYAALRKFGPTPVHRRSFLR